MFDLVSPHFFVHPKTKKNIKPTTNPSFPAATQKAETLAMEFNAINNQIGRVEITAGNTTAKTGDPGSVQLFVGNSLALVGKVFDKDNNPLALGVDFSKVPPNTNTIRLTPLGLNTAQVDDLKVGNCEVHGDVSGVSLPQKTAVLKITVGKPHPQGHFQGGGVGG